MAEQKHIIDDKITFRELILRGKGWLEYFRSKSNIIIIIVLVGALLGLLASWVKKTKYSASTSFVLEEPSGSSMGGISGLASLAGINLGSLGSSSGLFQGDNIMELYRSDNMLIKTLLTPAEDIDGKLLVEQYIDFHELEEKWSKEVDFGKLDFSLPREQFSVQQDSVMKELAKLIRDNELAVDKPDRKLSIIKVTTTSKDEPFAKAYNEKLVENVNQFYFETKTKKTAENLQILQSQADSVRKVLDQDLQEYARLQDNRPNPNPLMQRAIVDAERKQIDIRVSSSAYEEIVKNLEIAKINHRNSSPLIQIIDKPRFPLEESKLKWYVGIFIGGVVAFMLALFYLYISRLYQANIRVSKS
ncbi:exopolysaccharide biosynthesis protein [Echinicola strongylocentroti]|uniref:Exopolysaccharide biosynthesis protein n=1 Tax=Echinicola strongylocentroti TaxID=1795355 RepID=A0A2Z4IIP7_9BACT|nr:exopolysaccharide biosynthesis protein [Echinicola strongylocentroti]AWW30609.1 exopolysaccharide biosynthesis protein [Echinicola strongylocentroti]